MHDYLYYIFLLLIYYIYVHSLIRFDKGGIICKFELRRHHLSLTPTSTSNPPVGMILSPSVLSTSALSGIYSSSLPTNSHDQFSTLNYIQVKIPHFEYQNNESSTHNLTRYFQNFWSLNQPMPQHGININGGGNDDQDPADHAGFPFHPSSVSTHNHINHPYQVSHGSPPIANLNYIGAAR